MNHETLTVVTKLTDMSPEMQEKVIDITKRAFGKCNTEKEMATYIKDEIKSDYPGTWHCVVGRNFGSFVTHETKHYIYFYIGQTAVMLFKSG